MRVVEVLRRRLAQGRLRLLLRPLRRAEGRRRAAGAEQEPEASTSTSSARRRRRTRSSTSAPTSPTWGFSAEVTDDGRYLLVYQSEGHRAQEPHLRPGPARRRAPTIAAVPRRLRRRLQRRRQRRRRPSTCATDHDAPRGRLVAIDLGRAAAGGVEDARSPKGPTATCSTRVTMLGDRFVVTWQIDAHARAARLRPATARSSARSRCRRSAGRLLGAPARQRRRSTRSRRSPIRRRSIATTWRPARARSSARRSVAFDPSRLRDRAGLLHRRRTARRSRCSSPTRRASRRDGKNPTLLYGYGGFNISLTPAFSRAARSPGWRWAASTPWRTCAAAASTARRGTKPAWLDSKQNVFDDFIAAAEYLIDEQVHVDAEAGDRAAAATAACSSARA